MFRAIIEESNLVKKEVNLHLNCPSEWKTRTLMRVRNLTHNGDVDWFVYVTIADEGYKGIRIAAILIDLYISNKWLNVNH